jgi:hypothetical protein
MTPGLGEIAENAVHLVLEGHGAHADAAHEHAPANEEHGCSGAFHVCPCHHSFAFESAGETRLPVASTSTLLVAPAEIDAPPAAHVRGVYRPPIA